MVFLEGFLERKLGLKINSDFSFETVKTRKYVVLKFFHTKNVLQAACYPLW